eukprot:NODE_6537_length_560_cov_17.645793_g6121_i0.p1 GENE.NODE_6537_length_560_cov_17.645793_g6121_i0~~NODE_6537_length_560_cov_17.645793_g6121_i0.p1  ORF type:complete len:137 (+),score=20.98 NODE_6537_length_560_cov_17.645793_g6121_i0:49-411(+)
MYQIQESSPTRELQQKFERSVKLAGTDDESATTLLKAYIDEYESIHSVPDTVARRWLEFLEKRGSFASGSNSGPIRPSSLTNVHDGEILTPSPLTSPRSPTYRRRQLEGATPSIAMPLAS